MARLKLIVAYDGAAFEGWQSQVHRRTVQDELERVFAKVIRRPVRVHGAGRTDAGVHALAQCAHVDLPDRGLSGLQWTSALNSWLPPQIRVLNCRYVSNKFHARFSAKRKLYRYRIWTDAILPPLEFKRAWHVRSPMDIELIKVAAAQFVGEHDFAGFAASRGKPEENTVRKIRSVQVRQTGPRVTIDVVGDGFLYKMVRLMVGATVRIGTGKMKVKEIEKRLVRGSSKGARFTAPAEGLYLIRIWY